jgi:allophanate hydrolase
VNDALGIYTNAVNLLGLAAIALPGCARADGFPFGVTLAAPPHREPVLHALATGLVDGGAELAGTSVRAAGDVPLAVVGAHLSGERLNHLLTDRGGSLVQRGTTAPAYRLHRLDLPGPARPGLERVERDGQPIALEVWSLPAAGFAAVVAEVPPPLAIGAVELADGSWVRGFVCEPIGLRGATDITQYGGWRAYVGTTP